MNWEMATAVEDLIETLVDVQEQVEVLESKGYKMKTIRENIAFLLDSVYEWEEINDLGGY